MTGGVEGKKGVEQVKDEPLPDVGSAVAGRENFRRRLEGGLGDAFSGGSEEEPFRINGGTLSECLLCIPEGLLVGDN
jgi:hypothetical protein